MNRDDKTFYEAFVEFGTAAEAFHRLAMAEVVKFIDRLREIYTEEMGLTDSTGDDDEP